MKYTISNKDRRDYYGVKFLIQYWNDLSKRIGESAYLTGAELDKFGKNKTPMCKMVFTLEVLDLDRVKEIIGELDHFELKEVIEKKRRK